MTGKAWRASWSARSGRTRRAPAPSPKSANSSTSFAGAARNSKRCGATTTFSVHGEGVKRLRHPMLGPIALEYSAFAVDGRPDLGMIVYNPATRADADRIRSLDRSIERYSFTAPVSDDT